jgi:hypothetical protein
VTYVHTTDTVTVTNPDVTASDKENVKTVKEATLVNSSNAAAVAARCTPIINSETPSTAKLSCREKSRAIM